MPLSIAQQEGLSAILNRLSNEDIISLSNTVTGGLLKAEDKTEAVQAILLHTDHPVELLSRRKVKAETLLSYLHEKKVATQGMRQKSALVNIVLNHWIDIESGTNKDIREQEVRQMKLEFSKTVREILQESDLYRHQILSTTGATIEHFCEKFVTWFYHMLNSVNPRWVEKSPDMFASSHFWSDCAVKVIFEQQSDVSEIHRNMIDMRGSEAVAQYLKELVLKYDIAFNPNTSTDGLSGKVDVHGLVAVCVYGTVHKPNSCMGVFQQIFGLISDPSDGKWKIRHTNLLFRFQELQSMPSVQEAQSMLEVH